MRTITARPPHTVAAAGQSVAGQCEAPMQLWQLDLVGGVPRADGRACKMVTRQSAAS
ncbi:hypothetical protein ACWEPM_24155 [Streptomyces sp. NPDC004244]